MSTNTTVSPLLASIFQGAEHAHWHEPGQDPSTARPGNAIWFPVGKFRIPVLVYAMLRQEWDWLPEPVPVVKEGTARSTATAAETAPDAADRDIPV